MYYSPDAAFFLHPFYKFRKKFMVVQKRADGTDDYNTIYNVLAKNPLFHIFFTDSHNDGCFHRHSASRPRRHPA
jgi:hypothetical protein